MQGLSRGTGWSQKQGREGRGGLGIRVSVPSQESCRPVCPLVCRLSLPVGCCSQGYLGS